MPRSIGSGKRGRADDGDGDSGDPDAEEADWTTGARHLSDEDEPQPQDAQADVEDAPIPGRRLPCGTASESGGNDEVTTGTVPEDMEGFNDY